MCLSLWHVTTCHASVKIVGPHGWCPRSLVVEEQLCAIVWNGPYRQTVAHHENWVSVLLSTCRFRHLCRFPPKGVSELLSILLTSILNFIWILTPKTLFEDDRYFLSGSLDGKLRLWHIPDKKVALWNEVAVSLYLHSFWIFKHIQHHPLSSVRFFQVKFITALAFVKNGKFAVVGTYNGRCYFYSTDVSILASIFMSVNLKTCM